MDNLVYLLNMTVSGIKSIKKEICLDFYKKTIDKKFDPNKYRIKAIYGENGCGKSAIITAVKIFQDLMIKDNYLNQKHRYFWMKLLTSRLRGFAFRVSF